MSVVSPAFAWLTAAHPVGLGFSPFLQEAFPPAPSDAGGEKFLLELWQVLCTHLTASL